VIKKLNHLNFVKRVTYFVILFDLPIGLVSCILYLPGIYPFMIYVFSPTMILFPLVSMIWSFYHIVSLHKSTSTIDTSSSRNLQRRNTLFGFFNILCLLDFVCVGLQLALASEAWIYLATTFVLKLLEFVLIFICFCCIQKYIFYGPKKWFEIIMTGELKQSNTSTTISVKAAATH